MKKNITLVIALMFSVAIFAQRGSSSTVVSTKITNGIISAVSNESTGCYLVLQIPAASPNLAPTTKKLKLAFNSDNTLNINIEFKTLLIITSATKKLNPQFLKTPAKVSSTLIGGIDVVTKIQ